MAHAWRAAAVLLAACACGCLDLRVDVRCARIEGAGAGPDRCARIEGAGECRQIDDTALAFLQRLSSRDLYELG